MKKTVILLALALVLPLCAMGEMSFDGSLYEAYRPVYDKANLTGWEIMDYIEPTGLLLSATRGEAEISCVVQESSFSPVAALTEHVAGVTRYGKDIEGGKVSEFTIGGYEQAARVAYSYRSLRDTGSGDVYRVEMAALRIRDGYVLYVSLTNWGEALPEGFFDSFVRDFRLESVRISTTYTALLTGCERKDGNIYLSIDYCDVGYEPQLGITYAGNRTGKTDIYRLSEKAEVWLPQTGGSLYSLRSVGADEVEISIAIETYYNMYESYGIYLVLFDENGDIVRLQHYNAL